MKKVFIFLAFIFFASNGFSLEKCVKNDCQNGEGIWINGETSYVGCFKNGLKSGKGVYKIGSTDDYIIYNGCFDNDKYNGKGVLHIQNNKDNPYIFGIFKDGNLADDSEALIKFENGIEAYYKT